MNPLNPASVNLLHKVFVYGTLKRGEPNHHWFSKTQGGTANFICEAQTVEQYPLIIATKYNIPFLLYAPGTGHRVKGELYEVNDVTLNDLDILEDHPNYYQRKECLVVSLIDNASYPTWIYFIEQFKSDLLKYRMYDSYSNCGPHGMKYTERYLRKNNYDHKADILK